VAVGDTAVSSMNTTTACKRTACSGSAPARIMPVMAPGRETMPTVFVLSTTGAMASRTVRRMMPAALCRGEAPSARAASIWARGPPASCTRRTAVTEAKSSEASQVEYKHELAISAFTNAIARLMTEQGLSQSDLARRLGVSRARVSRLLQHKSSPTLRTMVQIANALGCDVVPNVAPCGLRPARPFVADGGKTIAG